MTPWPLMRSGLMMSDLLLVLVALGLIWALRRQRLQNRALRQEQAALRQQQEELAQLNKTKSLLFCALAHDVRSPLGSLYSLLTLLDLGTIPIERLAAHKEQLTYTLDTTLQLLDSLLNWSAAHLQDVRPRPKKLVLNELVIETLALVSVEAKRKRISLQNELEQSYMCLADPDMTRLVLRNLLSNAIKFTPEFGVVRIAAAPKGAFWEVAVTDTGVGITDADRLRIFGEAKLHTTSGTADERGTGLGLRLCKEFVERNGGQLSFQTQPELGTTFCFTIPRATDALTEAVPARPKVAAG
ncbi:HAMP domain-containing sensor histidine kinase [Hymenobacter sp. GOD-10R]|uniref:sensor histidine kinase n=1 Tax=Hymenobacter sp. GOD-10R TaxID=3093922 RepID=UPI002D774C6A|nr:HAMP domain-containing sensor histidine kinase [Hymenobacter sp. GOD-10R]WRQ27194.1 HAMP domain-containing sensor histidine kinase [Hymenobacter sp. GOD-10R]